MKQLRPGGPISLLRIIELGRIERSAAGVGVAAGDENLSVGEERRGMIAASLAERSSGGEFTATGIIEFGDCRSTAGDEYAAVGEAGCGLSEAAEVERSGGQKLALGGVVQLGGRIPAADDQNAPIVEHGRGSALAGETELGARS